MLLPTIDPHRTAASDGIMKCQLSSSVQALSVQALSVMAYAAGVVCLEHAKQHAPWLYTWQACRHCHHSAADFRCDMVTWLGFNLQPHA